MREAIHFFGIDLEGDVAAQSTREEMVEIFELLRPKPSSSPLKRIGGNCDGAYLVPDDLAGIAACFSPGVNNAKDFEDSLVERYGIACHMCDYSSDLDKFRTPLKTGKQSFRKKWLEPRTAGDNLSLDDWTGQDAPTGDLLLQMDIEGAEYRNLLSVSDETLRRFRMIIIEVHDLRAMTNALVLRNVLAPVFRRLARSHSVVHAHPNNYDRDFAIPGTAIRIPTLLELTYVRKDPLTAARHAPLLPHPMDISRNVRSHPPLFLGPEWLDGGRPMRSSMKMIADRTRYGVVRAYYATRMRLGRAKRMVTGRPLAP